MYKDFDSWNSKKKQIDLIDDANRPIFKEREIWWCNLGSNVGNEQDGTGKDFDRPVLVYKKFSKKIFLGISLSTRIKEHPYYHEFQFKGQSQSVIVFQIKLMDSKRLLNRMGSVTPADFNDIKKKVINMVL